MYCSAWTYSIYTGGLYIVLLGHTVFIQEGYILFRLDIQYLYLYIQYSPVWLTLGVASRYHNIIFTRVQHHH